MKHLFKKKKDFLWESASCICITESVLIQSLSNCGLNYFNTTKLDFINDFFVSLWSKQ